MIKTYISLHEVVQSLESSSTKSPTRSHAPLLLPIRLQNVSLIAAYYRIRPRTPQEEPLIQPTLFNSFQHHLHSHLMRLFTQVPAEALRCYFASSSPSCGVLPGHEEHRRALALVLAYYNLPHPHQLRSLSADSSEQSRPSFVRLALQYPHVSPSLLSAVHLLGVD